MPLFLSMHHIQPNKVARTRCPTLWYPDHTRVAKLNQPVVAAWGAIGKVALVWPMAIQCSRWSCKQRLMPFFGEILVFLYISSHCACTLWRGQAHAYFNKLCHDHKFLVTIPYVHHVDTNNQLVNMHTNLIWIPFIWGSLRTLKKPRMICCNFVPREILMNLEYNLLCKSIP